MLETFFSNFSSLPVGTFSVGRTKFLHENDQDLIEKSFGEGNLSSLIKTVESPENLSNNNFEIL